ncbi:MAG: nitroreductase [Desulfobacterota bacterium]|nr:nitroreductase [Thermodesulfobacteriota bacterium]
MELIQAIQERKSFRAFKADPIPKETLQEILKFAIHAPSAINLQPWEFFVVMGEEKDRLGRRLLKAFREKRISCGPGNVKPMPKTVTQRGARTLQLMNPFFDEMGVNPDQFINEGSCNFYGAPVAILICLDDSFPKSRLVDIGIVLGYLLLIAHEYGLGTCPIGLITAYEDEIRDLLNIPENKRVVIGVALGYPDGTSPINRFKSPREESETFIRWID